MPTKDPVKLPRDILSEAQIAAQAEATRLRYDPADRLPVPIHDILEFGMEISVVIGFGLVGIGGDDIDGYLTPDLGSVWLDQYAHLHVPTRARFTLAHECGHAVLHPRVYSEAARGLSLGQYRELMGNLDQRELGWIEYQANCFAGHLLVPSLHLKREFEAIRQLLRIDSPVRGGDLEAIVRELEPKFGVSSAVLRIRCTKDGLAPPDPR